MLLCLCLAKIICDDSVEVMVEIKTCQQRSTPGPFKMMSQQCEQVVGHLVKLVGQGLNFGGGIGISTFSSQSGIVYPSPAATFN